MHRAIVGSPYPDFAYLSGNTIAEKTIGCMQVFCQLLVTFTSPRFVYFSNTFIALLWHAVVIFLISMHVVLCRLLVKDILEMFNFHFEDRLISTDYIRKIRRMCISWCYAKFFKIPKG